MAAQDQLAEAMFDAANAGFMLAFSYEESDAEYEIALFKKGAKKGPGVRFPKSTLVAYGSWMKRAEKLSQEVYRLLNKTLAERRRTDGQSRKRTKKAAKA